MVGCGEQSGKRCCASLQAPGAEIGSPWFLRLGHCSISVASRVEIGRESMRAILCCSIQGNFMSSSHQHSRCPFERRVVVIQQVDKREFDPRTLTLLG